LTQATWRGVNSSFPRGSSRAEAVAFEDHGTQSERRRLQEAASRLATREVNHTSALRADLLERAVGSARAG
jgi:hypothetical protein